MKRHNILKPNVQTQTLLISQNYETKVALSGCHKSQQLKNIEGRITMLHLDIFQRIISFWK